MTLELMLKERQLILTVPQGQGQVQGHGWHQGQIEHHQWTMFILVVNTLYDSRIDVKGETAISDCPPQGQGQGQGHRWHQQTDGPTTQLKTSFSLI